MNPRETPQATDAVTPPPTSPRLETNASSSTSRLHAALSSVAATSSSGATSSSMAASSSAASSSSSQSEMPSDAVAAALAAARASRPRTYYITDYPVTSTGQFNICVLGCQGNPGDEPDHVATRIDEIATKNPDLAPGLVILAGDNFYPNGIPSPKNDKVKIQFYRRYGNKNLKNICRIPVLVALGNHDGGRDTRSNIINAAKKVAGRIGLAGIASYVDNPLRGSEAELQQVAVSYLPDKRDSATCPENRSELFSRETISYHELPKHVMPHPFYSLVFGQLQVFVLNSNTYARDCLTYMLHLLFPEMDAAIGFDAETNQAAWLEKEFRLAKEQGRETLFAMHHPLISVGKRHYPSGFDANHYLEEDEIRLLHELLTEVPPEIFKKESNALLNLSPDCHPDRRHQAAVTLRALFGKHLDGADPSFASLPTNANYNAILRSLLYDFQGIEPGMVCTAHDHAMYYFNNKEDRNVPHKVCQVVSGGGGSEPNDLQARYYFGDPVNLGGFTRENGCTILSCHPAEPKVIDINIFSVNGTHLKFTNQNASPVFRDANLTELADKLRTSVFNAYNQYLCEAHQMQEASMQQLAEAISQSETVATESPPQPETISVATSSSSSSMWSTAFSYVRPYVQPALDTCNKIADSCVEAVSTMTSAVSKEKLKHKQRHAFTSHFPDIDAMHTLVNFFNRPEQPGYLEAVNFLRDCMADLKDKTAEHSLYVRIATELQAQLKKSIEELYEGINSTEALAGEFYPTTASPSTSSSRLG